MQASSFYIDRRKLRFHLVSQIGAPEPWFDFKMFDLSKIPTTFFDEPFPFYADILNSPPALEQEDGSVLISRHALLTAVYKDFNSYCSDKNLALAQNLV